MPQVCLEVFSEGDASCLLKALDTFDVTSEQVDGYWTVAVEDTADPDRFLAVVIEAVLGCFADGRVRGFVLDTGDYRLPVGTVPAARVG